MIKYQVKKNTIRNTSFGLVFKMIGLVGAFITRTMLIHILGVEFVGLDGLFSSVLSLLNMAELGFSTAIVFKLYKPIAENDTECVCALLNYYKKIYRVIVIIVATVGLALIPFLHIFVNSEPPAGVNLYVLYAIYLVNTSLTYWLFAYKTALITAHQRNDLISKVSSMVLIGKYLLQFVLLLSTRNYYAYAIVIPLSTLLTNIGNALISKKYYPQYFCKGEISDEDKKEIKSKVSALVYNKFGVALINGSDNVIISTFLGLTALGVYDSYYYVFNMLHGFFDVFHTAITGGIGNRIVTESADDNYVLFKRLFFINSWAVGWCSICLCSLYKPFIALWVGADKPYSEWFSLLMALYFYFWMIRFIVLIFKNAQGLWWEDRYRAILEGVFNLVLNIVLVQFIGIYGITISTIVAMVVVSIPWETRVLFKNYFKHSSKEYYKSMLLYISATIISGIPTYILARKINTGSILSFAISAMVCLVLPNLIMILLYFKTENFKYMTSTLNNQYKKIRGKL